MKPTLLLFCAFLVVACHQNMNVPLGPSWKKVLQNDAEGKLIFGDKSTLIDAVRSGYPVRIGWGGTRVEHVAEADFLTIFEGEVFAQISSILGQAPAIEGDIVKIRFRPQNHWTKIAGTNGFSTGLMTDHFKDTIVGGNVDRTSATTWYVFTPGKRTENEALPLWKLDSPKWETYQTTK